MHRHHKISGAQNPPLVAQCLRKRLPKRNADILNGMVLVHIKIAGRLKVEIKATMVRKKFEHVIEEPDSSGNPVTPAPLNRKPELNARLFRVSVECCLPHRATFS